MQDYICLIPRNLNKPDTIIHKPFKLNWKQIGYIGLGIGGAIISFQTVLPIAIKICIIASSCGVGIAGAAIKYKGSSVDELAFDGLTYLRRKSYYENLQKRGGFIVTISSKQEDITATGIKSKTISISTTS